MGFGFMIWSWLSFSLPINGQAIHLNAMNQAKTEQSSTIKTLKTGIASFYHPMFVGRKTANGEIFSNEKFTAASNHFKLGTYVKVTNVSNGKVIHVKINDRMGHPGRVIDLTEKAARSLNFINKGLTKVEIEVVGTREGKAQILAQNGNMDIIPENVF